MTAAAEAASPGTGTVPGPEQATRRGSDFTALLQTARARGLLRPRRLRYAASLAVDLAVYVGVWVVVWLLGETWWALFLAVPAALFTTRLAFFGHDVSHRQVARTARMNNVLAWCMGDLVTGFSSRWWADKHAKHHGNPNLVGEDPDVDPGALIWTKEQAGARRGGRFGVWTARYQAELLFPLLLLEAINLRVTGLQAVRRPRELVLQVTHLIVYLGGLLLVLGPGRAAVFIAIHQALVGLHLGVAFVPGHTGMPMPPTNSRWDFLRKQVLTTRNVRGGAATHWFMGGLNHQIEHHLFPSMPRSNLRSAGALVRAHCAEVGVPYASDSLKESMVLAMRYLREVGTPHDSPDP
ncbi:MAG TPA: acyl-CoA desaturase [Sporichthyaceae bacterium]|jgi:fatty acid desaturase